MFEEDGLREHQEDLELDDPDTARARVNQIVELRRLRRLALQRMRDGNLTAAEVNEIFEDK